MQRELLLHTLGNTKDNKETRESNVAQAHYVELSVGILQYIVTDPEHIQDGNIFHYSLSHLTHNQ